MITNNKALYEKIEIPKELDEMINETIESVNKETKINHTCGGKVKKRLTIAILLFAMMIAPVNLSQSFAIAASEIPLIGFLAELLTFRSYTFENENAQGQVRIPEITGLSDEAYEAKINDLIEERVENALVLSKARAKEYKEAYIETGGTEETYAEKKIEVKVDYKLFSNAHNKLSFLVYSHESLAAVYATCEYYNIDVLTNEMLKLSDLLGENYKKIIVEATNKYIEATQDEIGYFDDALSGEWVLRDDLDFYINEDNQVVVVFQKYELAAGAFGRLEVIINGYQ